MKELLDAHPNDYVILAVDAQDGVGCADEDMDLASIIGPYGDGKQGWKGLEFSSVMHEYGLPVLSTLYYDELRAHTCHLLTPRNLISCLAMFLKGSLRI